MTGVPAGAYHLLVRANGFTPHRSEITVAATPFRRRRHRSRTALQRKSCRSAPTRVSSSRISRRRSWRVVIPAKELQGTLGETLGNEPGPGDPQRSVLGPATGDSRTRRRPRLVLEDGQRMGDLVQPVRRPRCQRESGVGHTHGSRAGPATLLYGANAIGGLVNVITNSIPTTPVTRASGATLDPRIGSQRGRRRGRRDRRQRHDCAARRRERPPRRRLLDPRRRRAQLVQPPGRRRVGLGWTSQNSCAGGSVGA